MCESCGCTNPEKKQDKPAECTPERIAECHPESDGHPCEEKKEDCKEPKLSRPTPEALGIDVYSTVRKAKFPIQVLSDYSQKMNRYAFLLIE